MRVISSEIKNNLGVWNLFYYNLWAPTSTPLIRNTIRISTLLHIVGHSPFKSRGKGALTPQGLGHRGTFVWVPAKTSSNITSYTPMTSYTLMTPSTEGHVWVAQIPVATWRLKRTVYPLDWRNWLWSGRKNIGHLTWKECPGMVNGLKGLMWCWLMLGEMFPKGIFIMTKCRGNGASAFTCSVRSPLGQSFKKPLCLGTERERNPCHY